MIPFLDLKKINARFESQFQDQLKQFLESGHYILGQGVVNFESNYAKYCCTKHCIGVSNGFDALVLIFKAYLQTGKLCKGDEVIVPANTFIASILAILEVDLIPVLVEPNNDTFNCEASEIKKHITIKTKAVLIVHLYGQIAEMDAIQALATKNKLLLIEDAAQAHGAIYNNGNRAGNLADVAAFSFYPAKNLGAMGDAGAITTNNDELATVLRQLRNYGTSSKYENVRLGVNNRIDEIQSLFLDTKLKVLDDDNTKRCTIAKEYLNTIVNPKVKLPFYSNLKDHVFHLFVVRVEDRDGFVQYLKSNNIQASIHYPIAPHKQKALKELNNMHLPITEEIHKTCVSLPISPVMTSQEIDYVIKTVNAY